MSQSDDTKLILEHMDSKLEQMAEAMTSQIEELNTTMHDFRDELTSELRLTRQAVQGNSARLNAHEERIDDLDGRVSSLETA